MMCFCACALQRRRKSPDLAINWIGKRFLATTPFMSDKIDHHLSIYPSALRHIFHLKTRNLSAISIVRKGLSDGERREQFR